MTKAKKENETEGTTEGAPVDETGTEVQDSEKTQAESEAVETDDTQNPATDEGQETSESATEVHEEESAPVAQVDGEGETLKVRANAAVLGLNAGDVQEIADTSEARLNLANGNLTLIDEE
jgi:hypothetical protein